MVGEREVRFRGREGVRSGGEGVRVVGVGWVGEDTGTWTGRREGVGHRIGDSVASRWAGTWSDRHSSGGAENQESRATLDSLAMKDTTGGSHSMWRTTINGGQARLCNDT